MDFNLIDLLILVSLLQGILLGLVLLLGHFFRSSINKFLAFFILMLAIIGLDDWLSSRDFDERYYFIDFFGDDVPWILLCYVSLFVYFLKSAEHPFGKDKKLWRLTIPFLIFLLLNIIIDLDVDFGWIELAMIDQYKHIVFEIEYYLAMFYTSILCVIAYWIIGNSTIKLESKRWLKQIWWTTSFLVIVWVTSTLFSEWMDQEYELLYYCLFLGISLFIYWLTYKGVYQFQLVQDQAAIQQVLKRQKETKATVQKTRLSPEITYAKELIALMEQEELYRNPDLNREIIAERLGISTGYLSQIINAQEQNFTSFINSYRVKAVQAMLEDENFHQYSLLAIGMEAGFKSKSAFYNTFKKVVGMTPNEYKKRHLKS